MSAHLLLLAIVVQMIFASPVPERVRRADDTNPLETVVSSLSQTVNQLSAQLQAYGSKITQLESRAAVLEQPVAFTVTHSTADIHGLGDHQTIKFDRVIFNAGSGYDPVSGLFTAPSSGTYAFYIHVMRHGNGDTVQLNINKGAGVLVYASACCSNYNADSNIATVHLIKGDTVHVEIVRGTMLWGGHTTFSGFKLSPS